MNVSEQYIDKITEGTGLIKDEILELAKEKQDELKGLISLEGALYIISKELGVDLPERSSISGSPLEYSIKEIVNAGMKNLTLNGRIFNIREVRTFVKKDGSDGKVLNFAIKDNDGFINIVVWDGGTDVINDPKFKKNALIQITNGYSKFNDYKNKIEVNLGRFSKIVFDPNDIDPKDYNEIEMFGND